MITIVYNKFDLDSLLAAAIAATSLRGTVVNVYDDGQMVPLHDGEYIWIGVEPQRHRKSFYYAVRDAKHTFFNLNTEGNVSFDTEPESIKVRLAAVINRDHQADANPKVELLPTLIERVAEYYSYDIMYHHELLRTLSHVAARFLEIDTDFSDVALKEQELLFLFINMRAAVRSIENNEPFEIDTPVDTDLNAFHLYLNSVKSKLRGNYHPEAVVSKSTKTRSVVVFTSITGEDYFWAMRLIRFAHDRAINITSSTLSTIVVGQGVDPMDLDLKITGKPAGTY